MSNVCEYYPCHDKLSQDFNCEFCYCPEYDRKLCSGNPKQVISSDGKRTIKDCSDCTVNHTSKYVTEHYTKLRK